LRVTCLESPAPAPCPEPPLDGQVFLCSRRGDDDRLRLLAQQQLAGDQAGLDRLANPDVVADEQPDRVQPQRHQKWHVLVGPRLDGNPGDRTERPRRRAEPKANGVA